MTTTATTRTRRATATRVVTTRGDSMPAAPTARPPRDPALPLADAAAVADLRAQRGVLTNAFAVFGTNGSVASEPPPRWLDDGAEIARRLAVKAEDEVLTSAVWNAVADVARGCAELLRPRPPFATVSRRAVTDMRRVAVALARRLPAPRVSAVQPRPIELDPGDLEVWGPPTGAIEVVAVNLCRAIDDSGWTDPEALAGWVADALTAFTFYLASLPTTRARERTASAQRRPIAVLDLRHPRPPAPRAAAPSAPTSHPSGSAKP